MSPESLKENKGFNPGYVGTKADIWSLGVSMYCVLYKKLPFANDNMMQLFQEIIIKEYLYL